MQKDEFDLICMIFVYDMRRIPTDGRMDGWDGLALCF